MSSFRKITSRALMLSVLVSAASVSVFGASPPAVPAAGTAVATLSLANGWNMVSSPLNGQKIDANYLKSRGVDRQLAFNPQAQEYYDTAYLVPGVGYFVQANSAVTIPIAPANLVPTANVDIASILANAVPGVWNLIGIPNDTSIDAIKAGRSTETVVYHFDPSTQSYIASGGLKAGDGMWYKSGNAVPSPVILGGAGNFAILSKAGITDVPSSPITGNIGSSPITGAAIGVTCGEVSRSIYGVNGGYVGSGDQSCYKGAPNDKTLVDVAVLAMEAAYTDAASRATGTGNLNLGGGTLYNMNFAPGVYTWGTNVTVTSDLTLTGGPNDVWIFQISGTFDMASGKSIILSGGAQAKNVFWKTSGATTLGTNSHFEGIILAQTNIAMQTGSSINGRLLAQTAVTLDHTRVTEPQQ